MMTPLGIYLIGGFVLYIHFLNKGLLFIKSYLYLKILWETSSPNTANYVATNLGVFESGRYIAESTRYSEKMFNGMQLGENIVSLLFVAIVKYNPIKKWY